MKEKKQQQKHSIDRGSKARNALVTTGLQLFSEYGLEGTSVRMLAKAAQVNLSAISYHFGGKEELYMAVASHVATELGRHLGPVREQASTVLIDHNVSTRDALILLRNMIFELTQIFIDGSKVHSFARFIVREQTEPTAAYPLLYEGQIRPTQEVLATLLGICMQQSPEAVEVKITVHLLVGQILGLLLARHALLRLLGTSQLDQTHVELVHSLLWQHTRAAIAAANKEDTL